MAILKSDRLFQSTDDVLRVHDVGLNLQAVFLLAQIIEPLKLVVAEAASLFVIEWALGAEETSAVSHDDRNTLVAHVALELAVFWLFGLILVFSISALRPGLLSTHVSRLVRRHSKAHLLSARFHLSLMIK